MKKSFTTLCFKDFWEESDYAGMEYVGSEINRGMIDEVETITGYKLPESYVALLKSQNGGFPGKTCFPIKEPTSWSESHVTITGILGIDNNKTYSLLGSLGSEFMKSEWGYPDIGLYICDCPSGGHDMIALDYRHCGKQGEPRVVHVDQEKGYRITDLAPTFEDFIIGLTDGGPFEPDDSPETEPVWSPESISFELKKTGSLFKYELYLEIKQSVGQGENGWTHFKFQVPRKWKSASICVEKGKIQILVKNKKYSIDEGNQGKLTFELLGGETLPEKDLDEIWEKFAQK